MKFKSFTTAAFVGILMLSGWKVLRPSSKPTQKKPEAEVTEGVSWTASQIGDGVPERPESAREESSKKISRSLEESASRIEEPNVPDSVLDFAEQLGERMDVALESLEEADELFDELEECVNAPETRTPPSVRALCLDQAQKLSETYPNVFSSRYAELEGKVDPDARKLSAALKDIE